MGCNEKNQVAAFCDELLKARDITGLTVETAQKIRELVGVAMRLAGEVDRWQREHQIVEGRFNNAEINVKISVENLRCAMRIADGYLEALKVERNRALDALIDMRGAVTSTTFEFYTKDFEFILGAREQERERAKRLLETTIGEQDGD